MHAGTVSRQRERRDREDRPTTNRLQVEIMRHTLLLRRSATRSVQAAFVDARPRSRTRSLGQAVVEFALIIPVFMLLLLVAVDFGRVFFTYIQLNNAAREGAAYAALNPTTDNATLTTAALRESNVQAQSGEGLVAATATCVDGSGAGLTCATALGGTGAGNRVIVSVGETFNFFTPLIGNFWPGGLHVGTSASAPIVDYAPGGGTPPATCTTKPPTPTFTWQSPDKTAAQPVLQVDASASSSLASPCQNVGYNWNFGGQSTDPSSDYLREGVTQTYQYATGGTYTVTLVVSNAAGDSPPFTQTVILGTATCQAPTALFTISPALATDKHGNTNWNAAGPGNSGGATSFNFDGTSSSFMSDATCHPVWSWDLGDTTSATTSTVLGKTYSHAYSGQTVHVKLTVRNDVGSNSLTQNIPLQ
jgi:Flp pilus assembly protein TadG